MTAFSSEAKRSVPIEGHGRSIPQGRPDWDEIRIFLEVARRGSFRSAAEQLGSSINALRRRIDDLERQLGSVLLTRHVDGIRVAPEGSKILAVAEQTTTQEVFPKLAHGIPQEGFVAMRANVSSAHYWAAAKGAGIG